MKRCPDTWIAIITGVLPSRDSEMTGTIVRIAKKNAILKLPVNNLFTVETTYHNTNQADKAREQTLTQEAAVIGELKEKYEWWLREQWEGEEVFNHYKY